MHGLFHFVMIRLKFDIITVHYSTACVENTEYFKGKFCVEFFGVYTESCHRALHFQAESSKLPLGETKRVIHKNIKVLLE